MMIDDAILSRAYKIKGVSQSNGCVAKTFEILLLASG